MELKIVLIVVVVFFLVRLVVVVMLVINFVLFVMLFLFFINDYFMGGDLVIVNFEWFKINEIMMNFCIILKIRLV